MSSVRQFLEGRCSDIRGLLHWCMSVLLDIKVLLRFR